MTETAYVVVENGFDRKGVYRDVLGVYKDRIDAEELCEASTLYLEIEEHKVRESSTETKEIDTMDLAKKIILLVKNFNMKSKDMEELVNQMIIERLGKQEDLL